MDVYEWDLEHSAHSEHDAFDTLYTIYCALFDGDEIVGTFRANRTDRPYLSAWAFPQLAGERPYPRRADIWEISRFGVLSKGRSERLAFLNYALMFHFAAKLGVTSLVATAEPSYERFLSQIGIETLRYGPPLIIGHTTSGKPIESLAGEIPISSQSGVRFERIMRSLHNVEISDASNVFGPARISA
ncbi:putative Acyl-homoserine-lactone synthase [Magnetospira sp. QH-2]|nr:putative Acyl-homoserine-lactone synthase [Magnetospira sp. QH-2]